jgi:TonB family protein
MHQGYYVSGYADSTWEWKYPNGKYSTKEKYKSGKLMLLECFDSTGTMTGNQCSIEVPPTIVGRYGGIQKYITDSLYYPKEALEKNIQGIVEVEFTITKEGTLKDIRFLNSPDKLLSDEVARVLNSVKAWYPAVLHNQVVDNTQQFRVPFYKPGSE